jgi:RNA polymerase sigma-70 factor (ECF subfamily)
MPDDPPPDPGDLTRLVRQFRDGDLAARDRLIDYTYGRFEALTRRLLGQFPALRRWEQTGDVLHRAMTRLLDSLENVRPESSAHFLRLGAVQIRRVLLDLTRHYFGPLGVATHHDTQSAPSDGGSGAGDHPPLPGREDEGPSTLAEWTEFHEAVAGLPEELQAVVDLHWYQGLPHEQVAEAVGADVRTVKRRWRAAKKLLVERLRGLPPGGDGT